ncbi:M4 family metallopeptidase [Streptomyces sp. NPDC046716]|uniref:M4 family metallopeptidase n=1 Tax=Streptomyces sp. NPDC046716 TaxID=3157093 RepID=UPI0033F5CF9B
MDSTLLAALVGTVGGSAATGTGAWLRNRASARTAARLVYAELTRDSSAVAQFRQTGQWMAPPLSKTAWQSNSPVLARMRSGDVFERANRGYEALDLARAVAANDLSGDERDELVHEACRQLITAIREVGSVAHMSAHQIQAWTAPLEPGAAANIVASPGMLPVALVPRGGVPPVPGAPAYVVREGGLEVRPGADPSDLVRHLVFDAAGGKRLDGLRPVRWTGSAVSADPAVETAYEALEAMDRFGVDVLDIDEDDASRFPFAAVVHYDRRYNNGWWNGQLIVLGDGDRELFRGFAHFDVVTAEGWWRLRELERLPFEGQSGALDVSIRDVLATLTRQYADGLRAEDADWLLADGLIVPGPGGHALRSLRAPGTAYDNEVMGRDPQPAHMDAYRETDLDNGGVHINGGIPNHAFYRLASELGGHAWERAGRIWWDALTGELPGPAPDFASWATATVRAAAARYGADGAECRAVRAAWDAVGVPLAQGVSAEPRTAPGTDTP